MAAKTITTRYGTKINIDGLTPEQVTKVRNTAEANGAYGAKGAALANTLRQQNTKAGINPGGGKVSIPGGEMGDPLLANRNSDPGTKGTGDSYTAIDNFLEGIFRNIKPVDLSGAPKVLPYDNLLSSRQSVYDTIYRQNTQNLDRDKQRDLAAQKQELAERGIPINFDSNGNDLYSRSIDAINEGYATRDQQAKDAANAGADQSLQALSNVNEAANNAFVNNALSQYQSQLDTASTGANVLQTLRQKYGLDQQQAQHVLDNKLQEKIANMQNSTQRLAINSKGNGGGGGGNNGNGQGFSVTQQLPWA